MVFEVLLIFACLAAVRETHARQTTSIQPPPPIGSLWGTVVPYYDNYKRCEASYTILTEAYKVVDAQNNKRQEGSEKLQSDFNWVNDMLGLCEFTTRLTTADLEELKSELQEAKTDLQTQAALIASLEATHTTHSAILQSKDEVIRALEASAASSAEVVSFLKAEWAIARKASSGLRQRLMKRRGVTKQLQEELASLQSVHDKLMIEREGLWSAVKNVGRVPTRKVVDPIFALFIRPSTTSANDVNASTRG